MSPREFLPIASDAGLAVQFDRQILRQACEHAAEWNRDPSTPIPVAVNLTRDSLAGDRLADVVQAVLRDTTLAPQALILEITESAVMAELDRARGALEQLTALGVRVAIDDFGRDQTSLAKLLHVHATYLKTDGSFTANLAEEKSARAIMSAVVILSQRLDMTVIAEDVETPAQHDALRELGFTLAQGYLPGRPAPRAAIFHRMSQTPV